MDHYTPPFTLSDKMLELVSRISEKIGKIDARADFSVKPHLRRNNRIRSIHSSLRIEANSLTLGEVRDVIDGHLVQGDPAEIREVQNAYAAYEKIPETDPYSLSDLKKTHGIMTAGLVTESGTFRRGAEGVFSGDRCIFIAPPAYRVPWLMDDLFSWMKENQNKLHPLILSAVFHYEFVFIHPFSDGNGRMARLWHTILLIHWRSIFAYIPLESQIEAYQEQYYDAISKCHVRGNSDIFIEFILTQIDLTLDRFMVQLENSGQESSEYVRRLMSVMDPDTAYPAKTLMELLGLRSRETFRNHYLHPAMEQGLIEMTLPEKPQSRNQRYRRKLS